jgi:hypothetical protein
MKESPEERLSHAQYEYEMAHGCIAELKKPQGQFLFNVLLAAFAVYWRNCQKFLTGDDDQNAIKAKKYAKRFKPSSAGALEDDIEKLHEQVLHLSGKRTVINEEKLAVESALKLLHWLERNMEEFARQLDEPYKALWKPSGPSGPEPQTTGPTAAAAPQATNHVWALEEATHTSRAAETVAVVFGQDHSKTRRNDRHEGRPERPQLERDD